MAHQNSTFIWQYFKPLEFVQFPWRFLTLVVLGFSLVSGSIVILLRPFARLRVIIPSLVLILLVIINWNYFAPQFGKMGPLSDKEKFSGIAWNMQRTAGIYDYLPNTAQQNPKDQQNTLAQIISGQGNVINSKQGTSWANFDADLLVDSTIRINLFQFPTWKIKVDGKAAEVYIPKEEVYGRMYLDLKKGQHLIQMKLVDTLIRTISNFISLTAWAGFLVFMMLQFKLWKKK